MWYCVHHDYRLEVYGFLQILPWKFTALRLIGVLEKLQSGLQVLRYAARWKSISHSYKTMAPPPTSHFGSPSWRHLCLLCRWQNRLHLPNPMAISRDTWHVPRPVPL